MRYRMALFFLILVAALAQSCHYDSFERRPLSIIETNVSSGAYEATNAGSSVRFWLSGRGLTVKPFYTSNYNAGLILQPEGNSTFKVNEIRINYSPLSVEDAVREEPSERGRTAFSMYYYRMQGTGEEGELTRSIILRSKCEIGINDTSSEQKNKFYRFTMVIETDGRQHDVRIIARRDA